MQWLRAENRSEMQLELGSLFIERNPEARSRDWRNSMIETSRFDRLHHVMRVIERAAATLWLQCLCHAAAAQARRPGHMRRDGVIAAWRDQRREPNVGVINSFEPPSSSVATSGVEHSARVQSGLDSMHDVECIVTDVRL